MENTDFVVPNGVGKIYITASAAGGNGANGIQPSSGYNPNGANGVGGARGDSVIKTPFLVKNISIVVGKGDTLIKDAQMGKIILELKKGGVRSSDSSIGEDGIFIEKISSQSGTRGQGGNGGSYPTLIGVIGSQSSYPLSDGAFGGTGGTSCNHSRCRAAEKGSAGGIGYGAGGGGGGGGGTSWLGGTSSAGASSGLGGAGGTGANGIVIIEW